MSIIAQSHHSVTESAQPALLSNWVESQGKGVYFVFTSSIMAAQHLMADFFFFYKLTRNTNTIPCETLVFPELPEANENYNDPDFFANYCDRSEVLLKLLDYKQNHNIPLVIFTTPHALEQTIPNSRDIEKQKIRLTVGQELDLPELKRKLAEDFEYYSEALCEGPGQFSVRGGILDVYPINMPCPVRIDFFGDEIEDIRSFNPTNQKSENPYNSVDILPAPLCLNKSTGDISDYLNYSCHFYFIEPGKLSEEYPLFFFNHHTKKCTLNSILDRKFQSRTKDRVNGISSNASTCWIESHSPKTINHKTESLENYRSYISTSDQGLAMFEGEQVARSHFLQQLHYWEKDNLAIYILVENESEKSRIHSLIEQEAALSDLSPAYIEGSLHSGFLCKSGRNKNSIKVLELGGDKKGFVFVTSHEILGRKKRRDVSFSRKRKAIHKQIDQILDFSELAIGDHLVHLQHGICIFRGISKIDIRQQKEEVISLEFANNVTIHLPLAESHLLSRYVGLAKTYPKLGNPGSKNWEKARVAAEKATLDLAGELLRFQAERDSQKGFACEPDTDWQREFESSFIHKETPDQLKAIMDTKSDMEANRPMDRLICGDVGYGKTEVAIRAAFKAVMNGKQVAILVPTTILCQQHMNTFRERMAGYPISVDMLSRFRTKKQQNETLSHARQGKLDILIGTHRLLSKDVSFKDLGLLVIDEEQRFGVKHKERLKQLRSTVDILTMSATPIPRTLYMALSGARELSTIETSPVDRLPIQTFVNSYDESIIKKAIQREISRGGQVFYLHNRVGTIEQTATKVRNMFPKLEIAVGHGQMSEDRLERIMTEFVAGKYQILVCTTIIETGLDIPNCNTMIIEGADRFGLSQLYQLRGRIGRFKQQAYAYLLLHRQGQIFGQARKRLASIKQYNQLGAGFRIAMKDLELRGAGNLLGSEQSGHIAGVGFDLYCQLLKQSVARLKGEKVAELIRADVNFDFLQAPKDNPTMNGMFRGEDDNKDIEYLIAGIPEDYISDTGLRILFYRKLGNCNNLEELEEYKLEIVDRFGLMPRECQALLWVNRIRCIAQEKRILSLVTEGDKLICKKREKNQEIFLRAGNRFPRLTNSEPLLKLEEIKQFIDRYNNHE